jgi:hypothetical protein
LPSYSTVVQLRGSVNYDTSHWDLVARSSRDCSSTKFSTTPSGFASPSKDAVSLLDPEHGLHSGDCSAFTWARNGCQSLSCGFILLIDVLVRPQLMPIRCESWNGMWRRLVPRCVAQTSRHRFSSNTKPRCILKYRKIQMEVQPCDTRRWSTLPASLSSVLRLGELERLPAAAKERAVGVSISSRAGLRTTELKLSTLSRPLLCR